MVKHPLREFRDDIGPTETRLGSTMPPGVASSPAELHSIEHDRDRTEKCLETCAEVLCCIDAAQLQLLSGRTKAPVEQQPSSGSPGGLSEVNLITTAALQECGRKLNQTLSKLYLHMEKTDAESPVLSLPTDKNLAIRNHPGNSKRSLVLENASVGKDGRQTIVCTTGDTLEVKQATAGDRAVQFVGGVSSPLLQEMLRSKGL